VKAAFIALAMLIVAGCGKTEPPPMGPVRLVEKKIEVPAAVYECRDLPAAPADYFDSLDHAEWLTSLWYTAIDCKEKLYRAGELQRGKGE